MSLVSRRTLVGGLGMAALAVGGTSYFLCTLNNEQRAELQHSDRLDVLLADLVDAPRIGRAARQIFGLKALEMAAWQLTQIRTAISIPCAVARRAHLRQAVSLDFHKSAILVCDRLVLSQTEVIVAGLRASVLPP